MSKYDAILFDMDGTLLDTLDDLADSVNFVLNQYGYPLRTKNKIRSFIGNGVSQLIELATPGGASNPNFDAVFKEYILHYKNNMENKTAAYPGIIELLKILCAKNYKLAIISNKFDAAVGMLNRKYFGEYIQVAIGESENIRRKPAPDSIYKALEVVGSIPANAVYVGDSEVDILTAKNAGMISVGVTWGFRGRKALEEANADFIIDKPEELLGLLE